MEESLQLILEQLELLNERFADLEAKLSDKSPSNSSAFGSVLSSLSPVRAYHLSSSGNSDSESDQSCNVNLSGSSASEFSEFANFQQQYENENLSQQELEDLWEQFNSQRIHESEEHETDFSEFANFQQQYENENLSQQELEDLWEQFNSHCNHESDDNFSSSGHQEEQEIELEIHSNTDENESLDPGGCQSPFSEASEISAEY
jgi:hypothetical protein